MNVIGLNDNKILWGVSMLIVNLGSRYIIGDFGQVHDKIFGHPFFKPIIVFCICFMATRDVLLSSGLAMATQILFFGLLHEQSRYSLVPLSIRPAVEDEPSYQKYVKLLKLKMFS